MKVLFIPSWFPSEAQPMAGRFVLDQVRAIQSLGREWELAVAGWGFHRGALSLRSLPQSARALHWRVTQGHAARWVEFDGVACAQSPALSWSLKWREGGLEGQLAACRRALALVLQRWGRVDLLHAHVSLPGGVIARQLASELGVPFVLTEHMSPFPFPSLRARSGALAPQLPPVFSDAASVMAVSPALAQQIRAEGLRCDEVVPNVVDVARFARADALWGPLRSVKPWVLLAVGQLSEQKGFDLLLRALAQWNPAPGEVELRVVGEGAQAATLRELAAELGVADRVRWLGSLRPDDVAQQMAQAHALVSSSRHETFGVVLAEALATGRPVLATRSGGPESVVHEGVGRLVPREDVPALAEGLAWLHAHAAAFSPAALRADAERRFGMSTVAQQVASVYARALATRGGA